MHKLTPFKNAADLEFKPKFIERYSALTDWDLFKKYSLSFLRKSIRVNTLKITVKELLERMSDRYDLEPVPWCKEGFFITHKTGRLDVGNTIEHMLGYYYVQEAASMIPPVVLEPQEGEVILDMCAAPGSKTSQLAQYMNNTGVLFANDLKGMRLASLGINVQRCGVTNCIQTNINGMNYPEGHYDRILLDAPCSGTGTIRKSPKTIRMWNSGVVIRISRTQRKLIKHAFDLLKPGGLMVYSTCSLEPEENEAIVSYLLSECPNADLEDINLPIVKGKPILEFNGELYDPRVAKTLRLWPQNNDTEGFFISKIRKKTISN
jgi:tRNA (cytosine49-C5)-methyltransferase